jgi:hypothetical protein
MKNRFYNDFYIWIDLPLPPQAEEGVTAATSKRHNFSFVIPAKAAIQWAMVIAGRWIGCLDSRLRGNDEIEVPG